MSEVRYSTSGAVRLGQGIVHCQAKPLPARSGQQRTLFSLLLAMRNGAQVAGVVWLVTGPCENKNVLESSSVRLILYCHLRNRLPGSASGPWRSETKRSEGAFLGVRIKPGSHSAGCL